MKTNSYKILVALIMIVIASSCSDQLDILPNKSIDASTALKTSKDVKATLIGAYSKLDGANLYGGGFYVVSDLLSSSSDVNFFGTFQGLTQIANKSIPVDNDFVEGTWLDAYADINLTNLVLNSLNIVDTVDRKRVEGEAKFIRAALYFELVKLFGRAWNDGDPTSNPGVPLVLTPTTSLQDASKQPARSSVAAVYQQIISDLQDAESLLPAPESVTYYYATTGAASAMLSRVYLTMQDYNNAALEADKVIGSGYYKLTNTYADAFPYTGRGVRIFNTTEDIFASQVSEQSGTNAQNTYYASSDRGGRGDIEVSSTFLSQYEPGDDRLTLYTDDGSGDYFYTDKFDNQYGNIKIIRLAEMYLTRAEANFRAGTALGATPLNDVNVVRARVKLSPLGAVTIDDILKERHLELALEGQWLTDYKRTNTPIDLSPNPPLPSNSPTLVFPIPQREMFVNSNLVQNQGY